MVLQPLQIGDKIVIVGGTRERRLAVDKINTEPNEARVALTSVVLYDIIKNECKESVSTPPLSRE
jgi:hypothetical protein